MTLYPRLTAGRKVAGLFWALCGEEEGGWTGLSPPSPLLGCRDPWGALLLGCDFQHLSPSSAGSSSWEWSLLVPGA